MKNAFSSLLLFLPLCSVFAQHQVLGADVGYQTKRGAKLGGYYQSVFKNDMAIKLDAHTSLSKLDNKWKLTPELGFTFFYNANKPFAFFTEIEATQYVLIPKIGYSFLHFIELSAGYAVGIQEAAKNIGLNGFTVGVQIQIPLNYYLN